MAVRRCPICGGNFPPYSQVACTICGGETGVVQEETLPATWVSDNERIKAEWNAGEEVNREAEKLLNWRMLDLSRAGFTNPSVITAIAESKADLRRAADLLANGCPEHLCAEILT